MKTYKIRLYVGSINLGIFKVNAHSLESAYEMAWDIASNRFYAEEVEND